MPINVEKSEGKLVSYIADQMFEDEVNQKIIAKEVIRVVDKYKISHDNVLAYVIRL